MPASTTAMETFIRTKLQPSDSCIICSDAFSASHPPVALPCRHIFGHACIKNWLHNGRGATTSCPICRREIYTPSAPGSPFTDPAIWTALCAASSDHIHTFMTALWPRIAGLFAEDPTGAFSTHDLLAHAVLPALRTAADEIPSASSSTPFHDAHALIASTWNSLGRPNAASGLAIPLVRLARLMTQTSPILPKWITTVPRTSTLFWRANACLEPAVPSLSWAHLCAAAQSPFAPTSPSTPDSTNGTRFFPLLHLYTVLLSQHVVHARSTDAALSHSAVLERCCEKIGGEWAGAPDEGFCEAVVGVYEALRVHQLQEKRISLRGHEEERGIVTGLWAMAAWRREDRAKVVVPLRKKVSGGWSD